MPFAVYFLTVSGVAATRDSPPRISAGMPICIDNLPYFANRLANKNFNYKNNGYCE
jgi:hypothetical protein